MKEKINKGFKQGVASFYIVAFSTLILVIVASSFAMVILSEVARTSNDDLSQSAYDSALAGVEDARIAYSNYQRCIAENPRLLDDAVVSQLPKPEGTGPVTCQDIVYWMNHPDCDMVAHILGRIGKDDSGEVEVKDTIASADGEVVSDLNQAYTCVKIETRLDDYRATLTTANQVRMVKVQFDRGTQARDINAVRVSWYSNRADTNYNYSNFVNLSGSSWRVAFQPATTMRVSTPPTLELQLIQTSMNFTLAEFDITRGGQTNRATVYMAPSNEKGSVLNTVNTDYYIGVFDNTLRNGSGENVIKAAQVAKTNDRTIKNKPFGVFCDDGDSEFACSAVLELPQPVNGNRNNDTFMLALALPYGQPDTDFSLQFCKTVAECVNIEGATAAEINNAQVVIDSTGRANDLYRRVETRLEPADTSFAYPYYAIQLLGEEDDNALDKDMTVTSEQNFNAWNHNQ